MQPAPHQAKRWLEWQKAFLAWNAVLLLTGCTTVHVTEPTESATEQLLVSRAIDDSIAKLNVTIAAGTQIFVDTSFFDGTGDLDGSEHDKPVLFPKYAIGAIRERLLRDGALLTDEKGSADVIVELRTGGQSVDHNSLFVGIPSISIPLPPSFYPVTTPELAFFKRDRQTGIAKLAITAYRRTTGGFTSASGPSFGSSNHTETTILFLFDTINSDIEPKELQRRTH